MMSLGFLGTFVAYSATQNLLSSIIPGLLGYWSVATIYAAFCVGALLLAPSFISFFKPKWSMVAGAVTYAAFMAANLKPTWPSMIITASFLGLGASILWAA
jgi:hypothetical protein